MKGSASGSRVDLCRLVGRQPLWVGSGGVGVKGRERKKRTEDITLFGPERAMEKEKGREEEREKEREKERVGPHPCQEVYESSLMLMQVLHTHIHIHPLIHTYIHTYLFSYPPPPLTQTHTYKHTL